jgi:hypothetical protein
MSSATILDSSPKECGSIFLISSLDDNLKGA